MARGLCSARGLVGIVCLLGAVGVTLYTYRYTVYWDRQVGYKNWFKFNFRECSFQGGFQRCFEPLWARLVRNLIPFALLGQALAATSALRFRPSGRPAEGFLPQHEYEAAELRHRHAPRLFFLKLLFLAFLAYHVYYFEDHKQLYGPVKGNARTLVTHTLSWMVSIPFGTLPVLLLGWVFDGCMSAAHGRRLKILSAVVMAAAAVTEVCLVFTAFGTRTETFGELFDAGLRPFLDTPARTVVLLVFAVRLPVRTYVFGLQTAGCSCFDIVEAGRTQTLALFFDAPY